MSEKSLMKGSLVKVKRDIYTGVGTVPLGMQGVITEQITLQGDTFLLGEIIKVFFENGLYATLHLNDDHIEMVSETSNKELEWMSTQIKDGSEKIKEMEEKIKSLHKIELCGRCRKELTGDNRWNKVSSYCKDCGKVRLYDKLVAWNLTDGNIVDKKIDNVLDRFFEKMKYNVKARVNECLKGHHN